MGIRARLKIWCQKWLEGSNPFFPKTRFVESAENRVKELSMKKGISLLLTLFVMALLATPLFAVDNFNELFNEVVSYDFLTETKINIEEEVVRPYAQSYEISAVTAVNSKQYKPFILDITEIVYIDFEMGQVTLTAKDIYKTEFG